MLAKCTLSLRVGALLIALSGTRADQVTVFAAASLTDSLKEIGAAFERQTENRIVFNFAGSSTLCRQIEAGAPADLFFSADEAKMDRLEKEGLVATDTRRSRLSNSLVIVVAAAQGAAVSRSEDLIGPQVKRLALGDPEAVPAGIYAKEYLKKKGLWDKVAPRVVPTENVRAALAAVESGNADAAIVYATDAAITKKVRVAVTIPREEGPTIRYPVALLKLARQPTAARQFLDYLESEDADRVFARFGFTVLKPNPSQ